MTQPRCRKRIISISQDIDLCSGTCHPKSIALGLPMTAHIEAFNEAKLGKGDLGDLARKIYLSYETHALKEMRDTEYEIRNDLRKHFRVGIHCVVIAGSAKTGYSFHQKCSLKSWAYDCFNLLSKKHDRLFSRVSAVVYSSAYFFETKQKTGLERC